MCFSLSDKTGCPSSIYDRITKLHVPPSCRRYMSILSVYDSTLQASDEAVTQFYGAFREIIIDIPKEKMRILLGDLKARVSREHQVCNEVGRYRIGKVNSNCLKLLHLCSKLELVICNIIFHQKKKTKITWIHPRSKQGHINCILVCIYKGKGYKMA